MLGMSTQNGAKTSVYLATSPEVQGVTGKYFDKCKTKESAPLAHDKQLQKELWQVSERLCNLK